jgi:hypothetical protein
MSSSGGVLLVALLASCGDSCGGGNESDTKSITAKESSTLREAGEGGEEEVARIEIAGVEVAEVEVAGAEVGEVEVI